MLKHIATAPVAFVLAFVLAGAPNAPMAELVPGIGSALADREEVVVTGTREQRDGSRNNGLGHHTGDPNHGQTELTTKNPQGNYCPVGENPDGSCYVPGEEWGMMEWLSNANMTLTDAICNRSPWVDAFLFTSSGIEFAVSHWLHGQARRESNGRIPTAAKAAKYASRARWLTVVGLVSLGAEFVLWVYDTYFCG